MKVAQYTPNIFFPRPSSFTTHIDKYQMKRRIIIIVTKQEGARVTACRAERQNYKVTALPVFPLELDCPNIFATYTRASSSTSQHCVVSQCFLHLLQSKSLTSLGKIRHLDASPSISQEHSKYFSNIKRHPRHFIFTEVVKAMTITCSKLTDAEWCNSHHLTNLATLLLV
jgi:hypothetical protein